MSATNKKTQLMHVTNSMKGVMSAANKKNTTNLVQLTIYTTKLHERKEKTQTKNTYEHTYLSFEWWVWMHGQVKFK